MPFAKLFRNRWSALLWAGGILWTAYDVAESAPAPAPAATAAPANAADDAPRDATDTPVSNNDLETLAHFGGGDGAN